MTWSEKTGFIVQRSIGTLLIGLISSVPLYFLIIFGIIPSTVQAFILSFGISAIIFLVLSSIALYRHFWGVHFSIIEYLTVNISITAVAAALNFFVIKFNFNHIYTALFGYTKPFTLLLRVSSMRSAAYFWLIYIALIFAVIIEVLFLDRDYKKLCELGDGFDEEDEEYYGQGEQ